MNVTKKISAMFLALCLGALGVMGSAHAAIPVAVDTAFLAVEADATSLFNMVVPYVVSILGLVIVIKLVKRFGNKI